MTQDTTAATTMRFYILLIALFLCGCEPIEPTTEEERLERYPGESPAQEKKEPEKALVLPPNSEKEQLLHSFTAEYVDSPVDLVLLFDTAAASVAGERQMSTALRAFAARLRLTSTDVRVLPLLLTNDSSTNGYEFEPVEGTSPFLNKSTPDLANVLVSGLAAAPTDVSLSINRPLLPAILSAAENAPSILSMRRENAFLAILLVTPRSAPNNESTFLGMQLEQMAKVAPSGWSFSLLGNLPSKNAPTSTSSACDRTPDEVAPWTEAAEGSGGVALSLCEPSLLGFFSRIISEATSQQVFSSPLPKELWTTDFQVLDKERQELSWDFDSTTGMLTLPRTIPAGTELLLASVSDPKSRERRRSLRPEPTGPEQEKPLEEEALISFREQITPILAANCSGGGCHGPGSNLQQYVDNFPLVRRSASLVLDRVTRAPGARGVMPPGGMEPDEVERLRLWLAQF